MGVLSSTSWFIINLFIYLLLFCGRKSTTKCIHFCQRLNRPPDHSADGRIRSTENQTTSSGIEPATLRRVAQCPSLNNGTYFNLTTVGWASPKHQTTEKRRNNTVMAPSLRDIAPGWGGEGGSVNTVWHDECVHGKCWKTRHSWTGQMGRQAGCLVWGRQAETNATEHAHPRSFPKL
jgi:hypothetical protein